MSQYAQRMARLSATVFGEVKRATDNRSMKVVRMYQEKPFYLRPEVVDYYPNHKKINRMFLKLRINGLFVDEHADFTDEIKRRREKIGKGKPKKGEGKRAMRRK